ncbi:MAG: hypothetical protein JW958_09720 [Candidatus Eisenbacteria bacterium]|nr:hypothetical protein [Candidatus Eisenbacteria bacterium]
MKACEERREELIELVFGEPDEERSARLNLHLVECEGCRREEQALLRLRESMLCPDAAPDDRLRARVRTALPGRKGKRSLIGLLRAPIPAYAAAAAAILVAVLVRGAAAPGTERLGVGPKRIAFKDEEVGRFTPAGSYETWVRTAAVRADTAAETLFSPGDSL